MARHAIPKLVQKLTMYVDTSRADASEVIEELSMLNSLLLAALTEQGL